MSRKRLSVEQIINRLRKADLLLAQGRTVVEVCRRMGVSRSTYYRWRKKYGGLMPNTAFSSNSEAHFRQLGFTGFRSVRRLFESGCKELPGNEGGVYLVLLPKLDPPRFRVPGSGGFFKGRDPNVPKSELRSNWVEGAKVLYIGKAGGGRGSSLRTRVRALVRFGHRCSVGHRGGRYLWQIKSSGEFRVCWMTTPGENPREVERRLIREFKEKYGQRPFANLTD